ncbi:MAG: AAA family ATPase [Acutalibacteraceae bacterium]|nr:AAA family ATPase [Acutalibacteraceae bacterium]
MNLSLVNIGKISNANIELNGITVIAGENNTGKSTVGKALYSVFRGLFNIEKRINNERLRNIDNLLLRTLFLSDKVTFENVNDEALKFDLLNCDRTKEAILAIMNKYSILLLDDSEEKFIQNIQERLEISDDEILNSLIMKAFNGEFSDQICNIGGNSEGRVILTIKDKPITFFFNNNKLEYRDNVISFYSDIVYIDDPFVLDKVSNGKYLSQINTNLGHMNNLIYQVLRDSKIDVIGEIITNKKLDVINEKINSICSGELVKTSGIIEYKQGDDTNLSIRNLSTGLKTFIILKTLLKNGVIIENSTVILDEPEIHLHPEWQIILAEVIVLLQKEFDLNILLNTHSPYFLEAIEVYSEKYQITEKCKYYLTESFNNNSVIKDVTDSTELIYKKLAKPFQTLENVRYSDD